MLSRVKTTWFLYLIWHDGAGIHKNSFKVFACSVVLVDILCVTEGGDSSGTRFQMLRRKRQLLRLLRVLSNGNRCRSASWRSRRLR